MERQAEDFASRTFVVRIHPKLPPFRFRVVPRPRTAEDWALAWRSEGKKARDLDAGTIEVWKADSSRLLQTLRVRTVAHPSWLTRGLGTEDVNFDGYLDLSVLYAHGAKWAGVPLAVRSPLRPVRSKRARA